MSFHLICPFLSLKFIQFLVVNDLDEDILSSHMYSLVCLCLTRLLQNYYDKEIFSDNFKAALVRPTHTHTCMHAQPGTYVHKRASPQTRARTHVHAFGCIKHSSYSILASQMCIPINFLNTEDRYVSLLRDAGFTKYKEHIDFCNIRVLNIPLISSGVTTLLINKLSDN